MLFIVQDLLSDARDSIFLKTRLLKVLAEHVFLSAGADEEQGCGLSRSSFSLDLFFDNFPLFFHRSDRLLRLNGQLLRLRLAATDIRVRQLLQRVRLLDLRRAL